MKRFLSLMCVVTVIQLPTIATGKDAIYSLKAEAPPAMSVDGTDLVVRMPLEIVALPKAKRIILMESKGSHEGDYLIQIDLVVAPPKNLRPVVVLGERALVEGVTVGGSDEAGYTITLGSNDLGSARGYLKRLQTLFGLDDAHVIDQAPDVEPTK